VAAYREALKELTSEASPLGMTWRRETYTARVRCWRSGGKSKLEHHAESPRKSGEIAYSDPQKRTTRLPCGALCVLAAFGNLTKLSRIVLCAGAHIVRHA
jgi:hypothetical protein